MQGASEEGRDPPAGLSECLGAREPERSRGTDAPVGACADARPDVDVFRTARDRVPEHVPDALLRELLLLTDERVVALGARAPRVLLSGADETCDALLDAVTHARRMPVARISAAAVVEHGYAGVQAADVVLMASAAGRAVKSPARWSGLVVLANIDRATRRVVDAERAWLGDGVPSADPHGDAVRLGRQFALADLLAGLLPPVPVAGGSPAPATETGVAGVAPHTIDPARWVLAATAPAFAALAVDGRLTDAALAGWGVAPELARFLEVRLLVPPPPADSALEALRTGPAPDDARALARAVGYRLHVTGAALARLACAVDAGVLSLADARRELQAAARRLLAQALAERARAAAAPAIDLILAPDDLGPLRP